jgi:hypothetical protein
MKTIIANVVASMTGACSCSNRKIGMSKVVFACSASLLFSMLLFASGSSNGLMTAVALSSSAANPSASAAITASPNPVPAGANLGKTTITWNTGDGTVGQVYVSVGGTPEKLFADDRPQGSLDAAWIGAGTTYEFRLYAGKDHKRLLGSVKVTRKAK